MEIKATPKEIADLILAIQGQPQKIIPANIISEVLSQAIRDTVAKE